MLLKTTLVLNMGSCASKSQFDREVDEVRRQRPDAAATVYSSPQGTPIKDIGLINGKYSHNSIPPEPETPQRDTIPARPGTPSASKSFQDHRPSPLPTSKVSAHTCLKGQGSLHARFPGSPECQHCHNFLLHHHICSSVSCNGYFAFLCAWL